MTIDLSEFRAIDVGGLYLISQNGEVFSSRLGRLMKPQRDAYGYLYISMNVAGIRNNMKLHRAVLLSFAPIDFPEAKEVNHKDGNKSNNHIDNLEWCTRSDNMKHASQVLGYRPPNFRGNRGALSKLSKPVEALSISDGSVLRYSSMRLADSDGFRIANVRACLNGKLKTYKGYTWRLV